MSEKFRKSILQCFDLTGRIDFLFQAGANCSLEASGEFKRASRRSTEYREVYDVGAKNQDFNLMLSDQSYFQFTECKEDEDVRLAYYPNPYQFSKHKKQKKEAEEMRDNDELTLEEYDQILSEGDFSCDTPLIRYDLSLRQHCNKYHPAAHFHIGFHVENRWPVRRALTPYCFLLKILFHYYPKIWFDAGDVGESEENKLDILYRQELKGCGILGDDYFFPDEIERLYFV